MDALKEPLNDVLYQLFENHTAVMSDDAGTNDIIVFKNGCVWVRRYFRAYVVGQNPKLPKEELNKKIEQELLKYLDKEVVDVLTALKGRFEKETQVKSFDDPAIEMWVSDSGDVYLRGKLNVVVSNHNGFSDDDVNYIEGIADDVMTNNIDKVTDITWYAML